MKWKFPLISGNELQHEKEKQKRIFNYIVNNACCYNSYEHEGKYFYVSFFDYSYYDDVMTWMNKKFSFNIIGLNGVYVKSLESRWHVCFKFGFKCFGSVDDIIKYWKFVLPIVSQDVITTFSDKGLPIMEGSGLKEYLCSKNSYSMVMLKECF
jgi:hypothetical protein